MTPTFGSAPAGDGFENSLSGLTALKSVTDIIYFVTYKEYLFYNNVKKEDIYLIKNFDDI